MTQIPTTTNIIYIYKEEEEEKNETGISGCGSFVVTSIDRLHSKLQKELTENQRETVHTPTEWPDRSGQVRPVATKLHNGLTPSTVHRFMMSSSDLG